MVVCSCLAIACTGRYGTHATMCRGECASIFFVQSAFTEKCVRESCWCLLACSALGDRARVTPATPHKSCVRCVVFSARLARTQAFWVARHPHILHAWLLPACAPAQTQPRRALRRLPLVGGGASPHAADWRASVGRAYSRIGVECGRRAVSALLRGHPHATIHVLLLLRRSFVNSITCCPHLPLSPPMSHHRHQRRLAAAARLREAGG